MTKDNEAHGKLLAYMIGWKRGAGGGAFTDAQMSNGDFKEGHTDGRLAALKAYKLACMTYGAKLSPLRTQ